MFLLTLLMALAVVSVRGSASGGLELCDCLEQVTRCEGDQKVYRSLNNCCGRCCPVNSDGTFPTCPDTVCAADSLRRTVELETGCPCQKCFDGPVSVPSLCDSCEMTRDRCLKAGGDPEHISVCGERDCVLCRKDGGCSAEQKEAAIKKFREAANEVRVSVIKDACESDRQFLFNEACTDVVCALAAQFFTSDETRPVEEKAQECATQLRNVISDAIENNDVSRVWPRCLDLAADKPFCQDIPDGECLCCRRFLAGLSMTTDQAKRCDNVPDCNGRDCINGQECARDCHWNDASDTICEEKCGAGKRCVFDRIKAADTSRDHGTLGAAVVCGVERRHMVMRMSREAWQRYSDLSERALDVMFQARVEFRCQVNADRPPACDTDDFNFAMTVRCRVLRERELKCHLSDRAGRKREDMSPAIQLVKAAFEEDAEGQVSGASVEESDENGVPLSMMTTGDNAAVGLGASRVVAAVVALLAVLAVLL